MSEKRAWRVRLLSLTVLVALFFATFSRNEQIVLFFIFFSIAITLASTARRNQVPPLVMLLGLYLFIAAGLSSANLASDWPSIALTVSMLFIGAATFQLLKVRDTIGVFLAAATLLSAYALYLGLFQPQVGLVSSFYEAGSLQGPLNHRNLLGMICALGVALAILALKVRIWDKRLILLMLAINISALLWTRSMNSTLAAFVVFVLSMFLDGDTGQVLRKKVASYIVGGLAILLAFAIAGIGGGQVGFFGLFQRDETFTGRTLIWQSVISEIPNVFPFGEGWNRLWQPDDAVTQRIWGQIGFIVFHSHQAFLDLLTRGGLLVTGIVIVILWTSIFIQKNHLAWYLKDENLFTRFMAMFLVALSFGESFFHLGFGGFMLGALSAAIRSRNANLYQDDPKSLSPASPKPGTM